MIFSPKNVAVSALVWEGGREWGILVDIWKCKFIIIFFYEFQT